MQETLLSAGFAGQKRISEHLEGARIRLAARTAEGIAGRSDLNIDEAAVAEHLAPAYTRQATGNSGCPKVDIIDRFRRHRLAIGDVGELEDAAGPQNPHDLGKDMFLIDA